MVSEAEKFAIVDETQKKCIEALNSPHASCPKSQLSDSEGLSGRLNVDNSKTPLDAIQETTDWVYSEGQIDF